MLKLKTLVDKLRGIAWPAPVRAVRCQVKSCNERDPYVQLLTLKKFWVHSVQTARVKWEEGRGNARSVWSESLGPHVAYNGWDNALQLRKEKLIDKPNPSSDRGLQLALVKLEWLVIACHHRAVNMSTLLAHTARQVIQVSF